MEYTLLPFSVTITTLISIYTLWWAKFASFYKPLNDSPEIIVTMFAFSYIQLSVVLFVLCKNRKHKVFIIFLAVTALLIGIVALFMAAALNGIKHLWDNS